MNFKFIDVPEELQQGVDILSGELGFSQTETGLPVKVEQLPGKLEVSLMDGQGLIKYDQKSHLFRALGLFVEAYQQEKEQFHLSEKPQFTTVGTMIDCSRNAVMTIPSVESFIKKIAVMGFNMMMLYTEDTYTIDDEPYFGHMRGRYSEHDLKQIDDYAFQFGIEVIPCIQTLGHMKMALKWPVYDEVREDAEVLLASNEKTYTLIDKMIQSVSAPLRSNRIHIGMDEAWGMGLGRNMRENGYRDRFEIFIEHINRVLEITKNHDLDPMIWSDMFFRMGSKTNKYTDPDAVIPQKVYDNMPADVNLVYWDYYSRDKDFFHMFIKKHKEFGHTPFYAGGIHTWGTFGTFYNLTFKNANAALEACKKEGVREVLTTIWQDDGAENTHFSALLGLQLYAEHAFAETLDEAKLKRRIQFTTGISYEAFMDLSLIDRTGKTNDENRWPANVSKYILWQDPLLGMFDKDVEDLNLSGHYAELEKKFADYVNRYENKAYDFKVVQKLASVLSLKGDIGIRLRQSYLQNDLDQLKKMADNDILEINQRINDLREAHRAHWFKTYKPFGWEVLDLRYGGLCNRMESTRKRILDYINGACEAIEELDEDRLPLDRTEKGLGTGFWKRYQSIVSPNVF